MLWGVQLAKLGASEPSWIISSIVSEYFLKILEDSRTCQERQLQMASNSQMWKTNDVKSSGFLRFSNIVKQKCSYFSADLH